jgi:uncharacterized glyoxalase superfamily protein PhnB
LDGSESERSTMTNKSTWRTAPVLGVQNVRQTAEYYRDVLGFELDPETGVFQGAGDDPGGLYAIVRRAGASLHFQIRRGDLPDRRRTSMERDVYIYVDDVDTLYRELRSRGVATVSPPQNAPYGLREILVEDPNGYRVTFGAPL